MGFKVLDGDRVELYDNKWREWTGVSELLTKLSRKYLIKSVKFLKSVNIKPDVFKV